MDPLTAFGLACNVIQVLSFGYEVLSLCKRTCEDGSPEPHLADNSKHLQDLSKALLESLNAAQTTDGLSKEQIELQKIASKLMEVTAQLNKLIEEVTVNKASRRIVVANTMKYLLRYKRKIQSLEKTMASLQNTMNSGILAHLCSENEATTLKSQHNLSKLDQALQQFIEQRARGNHTIATLISGEAVSIKEHVSAEFSKTQSQVEASFQDLKLTTSTADLYKRFLDSLKYDEMNARRSNIVASHEKTCRWILNDSLVGLWDNFIQWLKSDGKDFYWISGKAGSGKSTLMKFIVGNNEIEKVLLQRNPNTTIISFFFWNSGSKMQRSIIGMLCSLLHQILRDNKSILADLLKEERALSYKESIFDWSMEDLEQIVLAVFSNRTYSWCLFIDGLDEVDHAEGQIELIRILHKFRCQPNIKLCVSSRPEPALQSAFKPYPKLRLQDLTRDDIRQYILDTLGPIEEVIKDNDHKSKDLLIDQICSRADGVFLWVKLVSKSLQTGITNADDWDIMTKRLARLPSVIDQLYNHMWSRLNEDEELYRSQAAYYFKLILKSQKRHITTPISLLELMLASEKSLDDQILDESNGELIQLCEVVKSRVLVRCAGLLEFDSEYEGYLLNDVADLEAEKKRKVNFIHRSARDFLLETDTGRQILSYCHKSDEQYWSDLVRSAITQTILLGPDPKPPSLDWIDEEEDLSYASLIMQTFAAAQGTLSEQTAFKLLEFYRRGIGQESTSIASSIPFLCLAARYGHFAYVRYNVNQLELKYGQITIENKTQLLNSASNISRRSWIPNKQTRQMSSGNIELISWLLGNGVNPNMKITEREAEYETPLANFLKSIFRRPWEYLRDPKAIGIQSFLDFGGDLRTRTLIYYFRHQFSYEHSWTSETNYTVIRSYLKEYAMRKTRPLVIVIQVNCLWLWQGIAASPELNRSSYLKEILELRRGDVKPDFKVLQMFSGGARLTDSELEDSKNRLSFLQRDLESLSFFTVSISEIRRITEEIFERSPNMVEESLHDWMIRNGFARRESITQDGPFS